MDKWDRKKFFLEAMKSSITGLAANTEFWKKHGIKIDYEKILARQAYKLAVASVVEIFGEERE